LRFCLTLADSHSPVSVSFQSGCKGDRNRHFRSENKPVTRSFSVAAILALCLSAGAGTALADRDSSRDRDDDHERVWETRKRGAILPLETILDGVLKSYPGEVIEIEFDDDDGQLIYEIKVLTRRGIVLEMDVDARNGRILDLEEDD
jgi:uncharacterized membrane protein YkoI